jgi:hypothetical protein
MHAINNGFPGKGLYLNAGRVIDISRRCLVVLSVTTNNYFYIFMFFILLYTVATNIGAIDPTINGLIMVL